MKVYEFSWPNQNISLFDKLSLVVGSNHIQQKGHADILVKDCDEVREKLEQGQVCIAPVRHNYAQARSKMMGDLDLREVRPGVFETFDYYCQMWIGEEQFRQAGVNSDFPGPGKITHNKVINCEHTWPQSKFPAPKKSAENLQQKTDLHHIFSTSSKINGLRANYEFGEVDAKNKKAKRVSCLGQPSEGVLAPVLPVDGVKETTHQPFFEPPAAHKGNVARALFYFATRYRVKMSETQEYYLRKWNKIDPPDDMELKRNQRAYELSGVRNPYVDHPEFVDYIPSFSK